MAPQLQRLSEEQPGWAVIVDQVLELRGHSGRQAEGVDDQKILKLVERAMEIAFIMGKEVE
jgi:hypothetical protein